MNHTPDGYCEYVCAVCYRAAGVVVNVLGVACCGSCYSLWSRDVELYKRARLAELRAAGGAP